MKQNRFNPVAITFCAMMAAMVYVVTLFRFPLLGSKVHFANAICLLSGMILDPVVGGIAAGTGSALYDAFAGGYDFINVLITFVSKFAMAFICGVVMHAYQRRSEKADRTFLAAACGAICYVLLYMLKTFIYNRFVYGYPMDSVGATMLAKLIPSLINAGAAIIAAPLFYHAVLPALRTSGIVHRLKSES